MNAAKSINEARKTAAPPAKSGKVSGAVKDLQQFAAALENDPEEMAAMTKVWVAEDLMSQLDDTGMTKSELARRLGTSRQHVGEIINEEANLTLETMARLSVALDCRLVVRIIPKAKHMPVMDSDDLKRFREWQATLETEKPARKAPGRKAAVGAKKARVKSAQH